MEVFLESYAKAAQTTLGFFWMALWAFILGYIISSLIQVFVTQERMQKSMGKDNTKSVLLGTFFGFLSSSCSFSALASTKSLFKKGASFMPSLAFLLASTNLVVELGFMIYIFMDWQFVSGEYIGGVLLILFSWLLFAFTKPKNLIQSARERLNKGKNTHKEHDHHDHKKPKVNLFSSHAWSQVSRKYFMEWKMVWKDVTIGFTIAGIVAAFVPTSFFESLFTGVGETTDYNFWQLLQHSVIGPIAAFFTFIGSMGNIPLAALLYDHGVSFAGVMAFIFSDLVVFPVLRINAKYYGWKMSLYILVLLLFALILTSLSLHYSFDLLQLLPDSTKGSITDRTFFKIDYTFYLNLFFLIISGVFAYFAFFKKENKGEHDHEMADKGKLEIVLKYLAIASYLWLLGGVVVELLVV
ncbi:MAG: permease [Flavobacteriales bacterium]|nr:permease [Flavobacteriales bacterium]|tara:strand:- start:44492 stop:45724 length:1233 start_codon:yes stop_codon:yes gene_type:complete